MDMSASDANSEPKKKKLPYLVRQDFLFRRLGLPILGLVLAAVLWPQEGETVSNLDIGVWVFAGIHFGLWPYLAYFIAKHSKDPEATEHWSLRAEAFFAGAWLPVIGFATWQSVLIVVSHVINMFNVSGLRRGLPSAFLLVAGVGLLYRSPLASTDPTSPIWADLLSVAITFIYIVVAANVSYGVRLKVVKARKSLRESQAQYRALAAKLARYLSPQVYDSIFSGQTDVQLKTYRKKLTVFFSDIKGFTELTDVMESEALTALLNNYLEEMSAIALKHGGTIDKFIGDAIMVFFGDPTSRGEREDAVACAAMAIEMRDRIHVLRKKWKDAGISRPLHIRIGINSGHCTVGNFGSEARMDYTIIGGQVNLASRLESSAGVDQILISDETYHLVKDKIACAKMGEINVKGIAHPVQTHEVKTFHDRLGEAERRLAYEAEGLSIRLDMDQLADRERAKAALEDALERLNPSPPDEDAEPV